MHPTPLSRCASATTNFNTSANKLTLFLHLFLRCPHIIVRELIGASSLKVKNARRQTSGLQLFLHLHLHSHVFTKPLQFYLQVFLTQPWLFALFHLKCPSHLSPGLTEPSSKESGPPWARIRIHPLDGRRQLHHTNHLRSVSPDWDSLPHRLLLTTQMSMSTIWLQPHLFRPQPCIKCILTFLVHSGSSEFSTLATSPLPFFAQVRPPVPPAFSVHHLPSLFSKVPLKCHHSRALPDNCR